MEVHLESPGRHDSWQKAFSAVELMTVVVVLGFRSIFGETGQSRPARNHTVRSGHTTFAARPRTNCRSSESGIRQ